MDKPRIMKKIIILCFLSFSCSLLALEGTVTTLKGKAFLNNRKISMGQIISFAANDTIKTESTSLLTLELNNSIILSIKDSAEITLDNLYFKLRFGLIRFKIPENYQEKNNLVVESQDIVTSVLNGSSATDFSISNKQNTTYIALYQGDSLMFQPKKSGDKSLNQVYFLKEFSGICYQDGKIIEQHDNTMENLEFESWQEQIDYTEHLIQNLEIDQAKKILLKNVMNNQPQTITQKNKSLFYLAYIASFDNRQQEANIYFHQILETEPDFDIPEKFSSPKLSQWLNQYKKEKQNKLLTSPNFYLNASIPGLYQIRENHKIKGLSLLGLNAVLWSGFVYFHQQQNHYENLSETTYDRKKAHDFYNKAMDNYNRKRVFFYTALGAYIFNWLDANHLRNQIEIRTHYENNQIRLSFHYRF